MRYTEFLKLEFDHPKQSKLMLMKNSKTIEVTLPESKKYYRKSS